MKCKRMLRGHSGSGEVRGGKTRHGPGGKGALSLAIACLMLLGLCGCQESGQAEAVLTDLTVEYEDPEFRSIVFDNAVEMMAQRNGLDSKIGTQKLEILQDAVQILETGEAEVEESGGSVAYYEMVTPFTVPEVEGFQGRISMVVAVADGEASESHGSRYIKLAEAPAWRQSFSRRMALLGISWRQARLWKRTDPLLRSLQRDISRCPAQTG